MDGACARPETESIGYVQSVSATGRTIRSDVPVEASRSRLE